MIGSYNGLVPNRQQAIIWINAGSGYCCIYASLVYIRHWWDTQDTIIEVMISLFFRKLIFVGSSCMPPINSLRKQIDEAQLFNDDTSIISEVTSTNQTKLVKEIQSGSTHQTWYGTYYQDPLLDESKWCSNITVISWRSFSYKILDIA